MASSPTDATADTRFALEEITACWEQGYEALARGDLERVAALLDLVDARLLQLDAAAITAAGLTEIRREAAEARGRLEHGVRVGLDGLRGEMQRVRQGARALSGYRSPGASLGRRVERLS